MEIIGILFRLTGGLCLFLYGMKVMSDGVQQAAGDRMQRALNFMTRNRFVAVITGFVVTALVQSSSATTVMLVSFVNAGLLTLTQSIGVIMGANIGTTTTAWIVSLIGFNFDIASLALPAIGIGFIVRIIKWKRQAWGEAFLGFGFIFLGLQFLNESLPTVNPESLEFIQKVSQLGFGSILIGVAISTGVTLMVHSSAATITLVLALAYRQVINYEIAAAMILGANIGTTIDAILAAFGARTAAKQTALVHVLFNVVGSVIALIFFRPLLMLVDVLTPGASEGEGVAAHLAMFHSVFNIMCTVVFLPFVRQFATLVSFIIKDDVKKDESGTPEHYHFVYRSASIQDTPELSLLRAEKEIRDMAGVASSMYAAFSEALKAVPDAENRGEMVGALMEDMRKKEAFADEMREALTAFLIACNREQLNPRTGRRISLLLRVIADLEDMTDDCCGLVYLLERSVKKNQIIKGKEMEAFIPYVNQVEDFLTLVREQLGRSLTAEQLHHARELEDNIDQARNRLRKLGRKRIEAGKDVKTELLFIDMVRRVERLGDYCYAISNALAKMR
ncbi:MAG: Na/Pi cotransporter family protein [Treponema sp.]|jgi:phosphate:Na+ symporter|nr:Na/Pi cotransporter family protein [Treponema sp.]